MTVKCECGNCRYPARYAFRVPNNRAGRRFIGAARKYLNRDSQTMRLLVTALYLTDSKVDEITVTVIEAADGGVVAYVPHDRAQEKTAPVVAAAPDLLEALKGLRKQLREHVKLDVKKHYSLMVADAAAGTAIAKAEGRS